MARKPKTEPAPAAEPRTEAKTSKTILKSKYEPLMRRMIAGEKERATDAGAAREQIAQAVEKDNLHAKAFSWTKMLKKMPQAKRDELIFHLMTYFKFEGWPGEDMLDDRSAIPGDDFEADENPDGDEAERKAMLDRQDDAHVETQPGFRKAGPLPREAITGRAAAAGFPDEGEPPSRGRGDKLTH